MRWDDPGRPPGHGEATSGSMRGGDEAGGPCDAIKSLSKMSITNDDSDD